MTTGNIEYVSRFCCLVSDLTHIGLSLAAHLSSRIQKATTAMTSIPRVQKVSLRTAPVLFDLKVAPVASYGTEVTCPFLSVSNLEMLDKIKPTFLKRALGLPRNPRNRLVYPYCDTATLIDDL